MRRPKRQAHAGRRAEARLPEIGVDQCGPQTLLGGAMREVADEGRFPGIHLPDDEDNTARSQLPTEVYPRNRDLHRRHSTRVLLDCQSLVLSSNLD
jgi:hypothetical protein